MKNRTTFPKVFWVANGIEILERFAYYGIYMGFGILPSAAWIFQGRPGYYPEYLPGFVISYSIILRNLCR